MKSEVDVGFVRGGRGYPPPVFDGKFELYTARLRLGPHGGRLIEFTIDEEDKSVRELARGDPSRCFCELPPPVIEVQTVGRSGS